jgi:hypothetical protein
MRKTCSVAGMLLLSLSARLPVFGLPAVPSSDVDYCIVVAPPTKYNLKSISVTVILEPSEHSLSLYSPACLPREGHDVTTEAILPSSLETLANGKKLSAILRRRHRASVEVVGAFESGDDRYGPDVARFRFAISEVKSVSKAKPPDVRSGPNP